MGRVVGALVRGSLWLAALWILSIALVPVAGAASTETGASGVPGAPWQASPAGGSRLAPRSSAYDPTGFYLASGIPAGGGFCITPGGQSPGSEPYHYVGQTYNDTQGVAMWFAELFGAPGGTFTNTAAGDNGLTAGGPLTGVAAVGGATETVAGTTYALSAAQDTTVSEQIANDILDGVDDTDHNVSDMSLADALVTFARDYPGPWYLALSASDAATGGTWVAGHAYVGTVAVTAANGATVPLYGLPITLSDESGVIMNTGSGAATANTLNGSGIPPTAGVMQFAFIAAANEAFSTKFASSQLAAATAPIYGAGSSAPGTVGLSGYQYLSSPAETSSSTTLYGNTMTQPVFGTISVQKSGNDTAYYSLAGAVFTVVTAGGAVAATLVTGPSGATPPSVQIPDGTYSVKEVTPPSGYGVAPPQLATVVANTNTVVEFTGDEEDRILPATLAAEKTDAQSGQALAGATFSFSYDPTHATPAVYSSPVGSCTTGTTGMCSPPGNDGSSPGGVPLFLPGDYRITETEAPPGYFLPEPAPSQDVTLTPGESGAPATFVFTDLLLGSLRVVKSGNDTTYHAVSGATFTVRGPAPASTLVGTLAVGGSGTSNTLSGLVPGSYTLTETIPPPGYAAVPPRTVAVAAGSTVTTVDVTDPVQPADLVVEKTDEVTGAPLPGATFAIAYAPSPGGPFSDPVGSCTTGPGGTCSPPGNDGSIGGTSLFLPGDYQVTETKAPPGYFLAAPAPSEDVTLSPGEAGAVATVRFSDPLLVPATFHKVATGNVNQDQVTLSGAVLAVHQGSSSGPVVATCTSGPSGWCTTPSVLLADSSYCWVETAAPPGLSGGAQGCFVAAEDQGAIGITVSDPGLFVAIDVRKVDAADPSMGLAGATFDLYRVQGADGPSGGTAPSGAPSEPGQQFVAQATSGSGGTATFPLQLPGYAYCALEVTAPANFTLDPTESCSEVLEGQATAPASLTVISITDAPAIVHLSVHKYNSLVPNTGIPGATYDLYVKGPLPPGSSGPAAPTDPTPTPEVGDTFYARGTTDATGILSFAVPAGYAWCVREVRAPLDYTLDPALHCTAVLTTSSPPSATTVAVPETRAMVTITAEKFDSLAPDTVIPGATYELLTDGAPPPGYDPPSDPPATPVPPGDTYWSQGTTGPRGLLSFRVPAGFAWCLHELTPPAGYQVDPGFHCTGVLTTSSLASAMTIALPELPRLAVPSAHTGEPWAGSPWPGSIVLGDGGALLLLALRRRRHPRRAAREGRDGGALPPPPAPPLPTRRRRGRVLGRILGVIVLIVLPATFLARPQPAGAETATTRSAVPTTATGSSGPVWWPLATSGPLFANGEPGVTSGIWCAAPESCTGFAGDQGAHEAGGTWGAPTDPLGARPPSTAQFTAVSCAAPSWCMATTNTGTWLREEGGTWSTPAPLPGATAVTASADLSCPTITSCTPTSWEGISPSATVLTHNGTSWSTPATLAPAGEAVELTAVSCATTSVCAADVGGSVTTGSGSTWNALSAIGSGQVGEPWSGTTWNGGVAGILLLGLALTAVALRRRRDGRGPCQPDVPESRSPIRSHRRSLWIGATASVLLLTSAGLFAYPLWWQHRQDVVGRHLVASIRASGQAMGTPSETPQALSAGAAPRRARGRRSPSLHEPSCATPTVPGVLTIPSLGVVAPVEEGLAESTLAVAVGHDPASAPPGPGVASLLAAHDVGYFSHLDALHAGAAITYQSGCTTMHYRVTGHFVTTPGTDLSTPAPGSLVLSTCWPLDALFWTPKRYVVIAAYSDESLTLSEAALAAPPPAITVPAPPGLKRAGLTLSTFTLAMGSLTLSPPTPASFATSPGPLSVSRALVEEWIGLHRAATAGRPSWWSALAPAVPMPPSLPPRAGPLDVTISAPEGTTGPMFATATDGRLTVTVSVRAGQAHVTSVSGS